MNKKINFDSLYWPLKLGKLRGATLVISKNDFNATWKEEEVEKFVKDGYVTIDADECKHYYELAKETGAKDVDEFVVNQILEAAGNKIAMKEYLKQLK